MTEQTTVPAYGVSIAIEEASVSVYLREKALDAVQEQVVDDLNEALAVLNGRGVIVESDTGSISELIGELRSAYELAQNAWELAVAKQGLPED